MKMFFITFLSACNLCFSWEDRPDIQDRKEEDRMLKIIGIMTAEQQEDLIRLLDQDEQDRQYKDYLKHIGKR